MGKKVVLSDSEWIKQLDAKLWPADHKNGVVSLDASRSLTDAEMRRISSVLESEQFVVEMICTNMFGGYGINVYAHESYPGTGPERLLTLTEDHVIPGKGTRKKLDEKGHVAGTGSTYAWNFFSKYTHTDKQREWCKRYDLEKPRGRGHYDY